MADGRPRRLLRRRPPGAAISPKAKGEGAACEARFSFGSRPRGQRGRPPWPPMRMQDALKPALAAYRRRMRRSRCWRPHVGGGAPSWRRSDGRPRILQAAIRPGRDRGSQAEARQDAGRRSRSLGFGVARAPVAAFHPRRSCRRPWRQDAGERPGRRQTRAASRRRAWAPWGAYDAAERGPLPAHLPVRLPGDRRSGSEGGRGRGRPVAAPARARAGRYGARSGRGRFRSLDRLSSEAGNSRSPSRRRGRLRAWRFRVRGGAAEA